MFAKYNQDKSNILHVYLLEMMERIRNNHPDFYYGQLSS